MLLSLIRRLATILIAGSIACQMAYALAALPDPKTDEPKAKTKGRETAVLAAGCFWGTQAIYKHTRGVIAVTAGYTGGAADTAQYKLVSTGTTGHAESVEITYDPSQISYGQILKIFFAVAHDPTQLNRQYNDIGTQYRSAIFYKNSEQKRIAEAYISQLNLAKSFPNPVVTQVASLTKFYPAEAEHQNYVALHPDDDYVVKNELPKMAQFHESFSAMWVASEQAAGSNTNSENMMGKAAARGHDAKK